MTDQPQPENPAAEKAQEFSTLKDIRENRDPYSTAPVVVVTPILKQKVTLKPYMTGEEDDQVQSIVLADSKIKVKLQPKDKRGKGAPPPDQERETEIPLTASMEGRKKALELMVTAVDGDDVNVFAKVQSMPRRDRNFINEAINILDPLEDEDDDADDSKKK